MRGVYTTEYEITSLTGARTVLILRAPPTAVLEILSASLSNSNSDNAEQMEAGLYVVTNLNSATGTIITPRKHEPGDSASLAGSSGNLTVEPGSYDSVAIDHQGWNNLAGYRYDPIPEERPIIGPTGAVGLRYLDNPVSGFNAIAQIVYREIG